MRANESSNPFGVRIAAFGVNLRPRPEEEVFGPTWTGVGGAGGAGGWSGWSGWSGWREWGGALEGTRNLIPLYNLLSFLYAQAAPKERLRSLDLRIGAMKHIDPFEILRFMYYRGSEERIASL